MPFEEHVARKSSLNQVGPVRDERVEYFRKFDREQDTLTTYDAVFLRNYLLNRRAGKTF